MQALVLAFFAACLGRSFRPVLTETDPEFEKVVYPKVEVDAIVGAHRDEEVHLEKREKPLDKRDNVLRELQASLLQRRPWDREKRIASATAAGDLAFTGGAERGQGLSAKPKTGNGSSRQRPSIGSLLEKKLTRRFVEALVAVRPASTYSFAFVFLTFIGLSMLLTVFVVWGLAVGHSVTKEAACAGVSLDVDSDGIDDEDVFPPKSPADAQRGSLMKVTRDQSQFKELVRKLTSSALSDISVDGEVSHEQMEIIVNRVSTRIRNSHQSQMRKDRLDVKRHSSDLGPAPVERSRTLSPPGPEIRLARAASLNGDQVGKQVTLLPEQIDEVSRRVSAGLERCLSMPMAAQGSAVHSAESDMGLSDRQLEKLMREMAKSGNDKTAQSDAMRKVLWGNEEVF